MLFQHSSICFRQSRLIVIELFSIHNRWIDFYAMDPLKYFKCVSLLVDQHSVERWTTSSIVSNVANIIQQFQLSEKWRKASVYMENLISIGGIVQICGHWWWYKFAYRIQSTNRLWDFIRKQHNGYCPMIIKIYC